MIVHTAEKDQIKCFAQNQLGKITFFYVQTAARRSSCCYKFTEGQNFSGSTGPKLASFKELIFAIHQFISNFTKLILADDVQKGRIVKYQK